MAKIHDQSFHTRDLMQHMTVRLRIRGTRSIGVRFWLAAKLIALASLCLYGRIAVEVESPDEETKCQILY